jgi:hypothetical protein
MEQAAIEARPAGMSGGSVVAAMPMPVVRMGGASSGRRIVRVGQAAARVRVVRMEGIGVPMRITGRGGVGGTRRVRVAMFAARAVRNPGPRHLQGQHGQQYQEDESFHGCGL